MSIPEPSLNPTVPEASTPSTVTTPVPNAEQNLSEPIVSGSTGDRRTSASSSLTAFMVQSRELINRGLEEVAKPSVASFMEIFDKNPTVGAIVAAPALFGFILVILFFAISVIVLSVWTFATIIVGVIVVIAGGLLSLLLKLVLVTAATVPMAAMATGFLVISVTVFEFLMSPAMTFFWAFGLLTPRSSENDSQPPENAQDAAPQEPVAASQEPVSSQSNSHESIRINLITAARVAWDSAVILGSFLNWTSKKLWIVGGKAVTEVRKNIEEAKRAHARAQAQAQAQAQRTVSESTPQDEEEPVPSNNVSLIPPASSSTDNTTLTQRASHSRVKDDDE
ncbi:hypothetical protein CVT24_009192 [Panaeolus cyanescens]|uniref:Uncharacterized protein n=1 Tax=Panaeolus cyanescens TaxID=181874 RepID=A0A409Y894_9AGAR|nr:hypothetical protein CVT24_009192 [Panaeolus cyanescens]